MECGGKEVRADAVWVSMPFRVEGPVINALAFLPRLIAVLGRHYSHAAGYDDMQLPAQRPRRLLHIFALVGDFRTLRVNHQYGDGDVRYQFAQQLQLLGPQFSIEPADSCYVCARAAQASDETNLNGVGTAREDDRDGCSRSF